MVLSACLVAAAVGLSGATSGVRRAESASACATYGGWIDVKTGRSLDRAELFGDLVAKGAVVLLGESHTDVDHHLWQLQTVAALHGRGANLVIGFEAFPRRLQPVLDDWIAGKLTDEAFLKASEWRQVWGYDAALYMPLFEFARLNRIPMIALNVERTLVSQVGQKGWDAVPVCGARRPYRSCSGHSRLSARTRSRLCRQEDNAARRRRSHDPRSRGEIAEPDEAAVRTR